MITKKLKKCASYSLTYSRFLTSKNIPTKSRKILLLLFFYLPYFCLNAQLIPITLDQKIQQSETIIEGKIIEQKSYESASGEIYTENKIEIFSFIKGAINTPQLSIITLGGQTDRHEVTWTHLASLKKGQQGVFFLIKTERPSTHSQHLYELYASSQGFYEVLNDEDGFKIISPLEKFDDPKELYQRLNVNYSAINGRFTNFQIENDNCIILKIVVNLEGSSLQQSSLLNADLYVKINQGFKYLYRSNFIIKYSGDFFGQNIVGAGNLSFQGGELVTPSYDLLMTDYQSDKLEIKLDGLTTNTSNLEKVNTEFKHLASVQVNLIGWSNDSPLDWNPNDGNTSNLYVDASTELIQAFECGDVIVQELGATPEITGFSPTTAAAGVKNASDNTAPISGIVTISGSGFETPAAGQSTPEGFYVKFENLSGSWIAPFEGDYISWTDTEIQVRVPSIGYDNNSDDIISDTGKEMACTGRIRVCNDGFLSCGTFATTDGNLYIPFAAHNTTQTNMDGKLEAVRVALLNFIDGGYDVRFNSNFTGESIAAFTRALTTWRCNTRVNFDANTTDPPTSGNGFCRVRYGSLPVGVGSATRGRTTFDPIDCETTPFVDFSYVPDFLLVFNNNINWHTGTDTPSTIDWDGSSGTIGADLESTALHELGHAHQLLHTCNSENVMISPGALSFSRTLTNDDLNGGNHISLLSNSILDPDCPVSGMELIDLSECELTSTFNVDETTIQISIYPNPTSEKSNIKINTTDKINGIIDIYSLTGSILASKKINGNSTSINLEQFSSGIYHLVYRDKSGKNYFLGKISKN